MKTIYETPEMQLKILEEEDIIITSSPGNGLINGGPDGIEDESGWGGLF